MSSVRGVLDFLDPPLGLSFTLTPEEALALMRDKGLKQTFDWRDAYAEEHVASFTVAKMMDTDLLADVQASLVDALDRGVPFGEWSDSIIPTLQARGWWGRQRMVDPLSGREIVAQLGSPSRLETIFRTNMQTAYAAGAWQQIEDQAELAPFLMYDAVDDHRTRPEHHAWDGTVLEVRHPWWRTHYPPNGWNCRCGVIQLSGDDLADLGLSVTPKAPQDGFYTWDNPRTGKSQAIPQGVDPGFNYNAGEERLRQLTKVATEKAKALPTPAPPAALKGLVEADKAALDTLRADREAAEAAARRAELTFDPSTPAGEYHVASWQGAPQWLRRQVVAEQAVDVLPTTQGASAAGGQFINWPTKYQVTSAHNRDVWRHEFGHIMDARLGRKHLDEVKAGLYVSSGEKFTKAMRADAAAMTKRSAGQAGRYDALRDKLVDMDGRNARETYLRDKATALGLDFDQLKAALQANSAALFDTLAGDVRLARILEAIELGDGERFLIEAVGRRVDNVLEGATWEEQRLNSANIAESWKKGVLPSLSDLFGAASKNRIAGYSRGFSGHSDAYYNKRRGFGQQTEAFANLTALAGAPEPIWWDLLSRFFAPKMAQTYQELITRG